MPLKSVTSEVPSPVAFKNLTDGNVLLYWINFSGRAVFYAILKPCTRKDPGLEIDTFVSHPWVAVERRSKQLLKLNWKHVFMPPNPSSWNVEVRRMPSMENIPLIRLPVRDNGVFHLYHKMRLSSSESNLDDGDYSSSDESSRSNTSRLVSANEESLNTNDNSQEFDLSSVMDLKYEVVVTHPVLRLEILCHQKICEVIHHEHHHKLPLSTWLQEELRKTLEKWFY